MSTRRGKQVIVEGPWPGGLNLRTSRFSTQVPQGQFIWCKNMDPQRDGTLLSRRGFRYVIPNGGNLYAAPLVRFDFLGETYPASGNVGAVVGKVTAAGSTQLWSTTAGHDSSSFSQCAAPAVPTELIACLNYNNKYWLVPRAKNTGGNPVNGGYSTPNIFAATALTAIPNMPYGDKAFIWKDRLWVIDYAANKVSWSKATDPSVWSSPDGGYFILSGDTTKPINDVFVSGDTLYIFKRNGWYQFNFSVDPSTDGYLRQMGVEMGAYTTFQYLDENYLVNFKGVFKFVGGNFIPLSGNLSLDFNAVERYSVVLSVCNNMLIMQPTSGMVEPLWDAYAMNLDTGAWTTYDFGGSDNTGIGAFTKPLVTFDGSNRRVLYGDGKTWLVYAIDRPWVGGFAFATTDQYHSDSHFYQPEYSLITKAIDFGDADTWKRCHKLEVLGYSNLIAADGDITWKIRTTEEDPSQDSAFDVVSNPLVNLKTNMADSTGLRKLVVFAQHFRFRLFAVWMNKPTTDLGVADPGFGIYYKVFQISATASMRTNEINAVNA